MSASIHKLNKAFESRIRLGIMSLLSVNDEVDFNYLKGELEVTDGNLASHVKALEKLSYLHVEKRFVGRKPNTLYSITKKGERAFKEHIDELEKLLKLGK